MTITPKQRPRFPYTNFLRKLREVLDADETGLLVGFIDQAICDLATEVAKADPEKITRATNNFVSGHAWVRCAEQILAKFRPDRAQDDLFAIVAEKRQDA